MKPNWIATGAFLAALAVMTGAFGAHGLKERLSVEEMATWQTGVLYHALNAPGLVLFGLFDREDRGRLAPWSLLIGIVLFSGSLYLMALGGSAALGMITPLGGVLLILGWLAFAWQARRDISARE
ncbi:MAG: DUF423 domain-containing protein [Planctomycetes bacterium]|nr:DUF423 domain-containing protein [Planctomycetota bacterium]